MMHTPTIELHDDDLIVALSRDHTFLHVGSVHAMLGHARHTHDPETAKADTVIDVFDHQGHLLVPVLDDTFTVVGFVADPARGTHATEVHDRIATTLALAQELLTTRPELGARPGGLPRATEVPTLTGATLRDTLDELAAHFDVAPGMGHRAGWFHNLIHALG